MQTRLQQGQKDRGQVLWSLSPDASRRITMPSLLQADICGHADTQRRRRVSNVDSTQFITLFQRKVINRAFIVALRNVIDRSLRDDFLVSQIGPRPDEQGSQIVVDLLEQCHEDIQEEYAKLHTDMRQFR